MKPGVCNRGENVVGGLDPLVGCSAYCAGGPSVFRALCCSPNVDAIFCLGLSCFPVCCSTCCGLSVGGGCGLRCGASCFCTLLSALGCCVSGGNVTAASTGAPTRAAFFETRLVGRKVHRRFRPAHLEHGNFLSHFVFVLAQLLQAIGVLPADLGIIPLAAGISCCPV